jgi:hypothetical protein
MDQTHDAPRVQTDYLHLKARADSPFAYMMHRKFDPFAWPRSDTLLRISIFCFSPHQL